MNHVDNLQDTFHVALRKFFKTPKGSAHPLVAAYQELSLPKDPNTKALPVTIPAYEPKNFVGKGWQYQTINTIQNIVQTELAGYVDHFFIHGSFATRDFISNWSDLDTLVILNDKVFQNKEILRQAKEKLFRLSMLCYKIDPLTHHLFSYLTAFDLNYYPRYFFPPELFPYALSLGGKATIVLKIRSDSPQKVQKASEFVNNFEKNYAGQPCKLTPFSWKVALSQVLLWPSLSLQKRSVYVYKRDSFALFKKKFPNIDCSPLDAASRCRLLWQRVNLLKYIPDSFFLKADPSLVLKIVYAHNLLTGERFSSKKQQQMTLLTEELLSLMKKSL